MQQASNMLNRRSGDPVGVAYSRQERVYKKEGQWFFRRRDANDMGPYIDKQNAYWALARYLRQRS